MLSPVITGPLEKDDELSIGTITSPSQVVHPLVHHLLYRLWPEIALTALDGFSLRGFHLTPLQSSAVGPGLLVDLRVLQQYTFVTT